MAGIGNAIAAALGGYADGAMLADDRQYQRERRAAAIEMEQMQLDRARALRAAEQRVNSTDYNLPELTRTYQAPDLTAMSEIPPMVERTVQVRPAGVDRVAQMRDTAQLARLSGNYKDALELELKSENLPYELAKSSLARARQAMEMGNFAGAAQYMRAAHSTFPDGETIVDLQFDPKSGRYFMQTLDEDTGEALSSSSFSVAEASDLLTRMSDPKMWLEQQKFRHDQFKDRHKMAIDEGTLAVKQADSQTKAGQLQHNIWRDVEQLKVSRGQLGVAQQNARTSAALAADRLADLDVRAVNLGNRVEFYNGKTGQRIRAEEAGVDPDVWARIQAEGGVNSKKALDNRIKLDLEVGAAARQMRFAELDLDPMRPPTDAQQLARWRAAGADASMHQKITMLNRENPDVTFGELMGPAYVYSAFMDPTRRGQAVELARQHGIAIGPAGQLFQDVPQRDGTVVRRMMTTTGKPIAVDLIAPAPRAAVTVGDTPAPFPLSSQASGVPTALPPPMPVPPARRQPAIDLPNDIPR